MSYAVWLQGPDRLTRPCEEGRETYNVYWRRREAVKTSHLAMAVPGWDRPDTGTHSTIPYSGRRRAGFAALRMVNADGPRGFPGSVDGSTAARRAVREAPARGLCTGDTTRTRRSRRWRGAGFRASARCRRAASGRPWGRP